MQAKVLEVTCWVVFPRIGVIIKATEGKLTMRIIKASELVRAFAWRKFMGTPYDSWLSLTNYSMLSA